MKYFFNLQERLLSFVWLELIHTFDVKFELIMLDLHLFAYSESEDACTIHRHTSMQIIGTELVGSVG